MKRFDKKLLSGFNGKDGRPAYIAHQGRIIDVSESRLWRGGLHMKRHHAGSDLTPDIQAAPHGPEVLERFQQVGILSEEEDADQALPKPLAAILARFPFLRRHPHPMMVHYPIAFMFSATLFNLLYLITGVGSFESTALNCLGAGILFIPVAGLTGIYTWWLNYGMRPLRPIKIKIRCSILLLAGGIAAFVWRIADPSILVSFRPLSILYLALLVSFLPLITMIGWHGAQMTFPVEEEA